MDGFRLKLRRIFSFNHLQLTVWSMIRKIWKGNAFWPQKMNGIVDSVYDSNVIKLAAKEEAAEGLRIPKEIQKELNRKKR